MTIKYDEEGRKNEAKADVDRTAIQNRNLTTSHLLEYTIEA